MEVFECTNCGWRCFTKEEWDHHQCGDNISELSKIKAFVAYLEYSAEVARRARKQKKLFDFKKEGIVEKRRRPFSLMEVE